MNFGKKILFIVFYLALDKKCLQKENNINELLQPVIIMQQYLLS